MVIDEDAWNVLVVCCPQGFAQFFSKVQVVIDEDAWNVLWVWDSCAQFCSIFLKISQNFSNFLKGYRVVGLGRSSMYLKLAQCCREQMRSVLLKMSTSCQPGRYSSSEANVGNSLGPGSHKM